MTSDESNVTEHLYKVLVIGDFGVGKVSFKLLTAPGFLCDMDFLLETHKMDEADVLVELPTSIIRRYTEGTFSPNYKLTIGVDFCLKSLNWNKNTKVNLQLWDIAGHERFGHMTRVYYKYAIAAIIMFDLSRPATFDSVIKWSEDVNQKVMLANEQPIPVLLLANKCDLEDVSINDRALNEFCAKQNFLGWFSTSAKNNVNIDEAMHFLVENILQLNNQNVQPDGDHISLHQDREYFEVIEEDRTPLSKVKDQCCR